MSFITSHWKLILIGIAVLIVLVWIGSVTGANSKLYGMLVDQLRDDKSRVVEVQAENQKWYEETIRSIQDKLDAKEKELIATEAKLWEANRSIDEKDAEIFKLRKEREGIVTSSDPNLIVDDLHKLGYGSEHRRAR